MRPATSIKHLTLDDLRALASGQTHVEVSDADFLETLAAQQCFVLTPWIMRARAPECGGGLERVAQLIFDEDGNIDKARMLLLVVRVLRLRRERQRPGDAKVDFGPRFTG